MPVGEIGKCLQQYSGAGESLCVCEVYSAKCHIVLPLGSSLPQLIKAKFKGLKKLIEGFKLLFYIDQSHSLNPCVSLSAEFVSMKRLDAHGEGLSTFFVFEPVKGYVPSSAHPSSDIVLSTSSPPPLYPTSRHAAHTTPTPTKGSGPSGNKTSKKNKKSSQQQQQQAGVHRVGGLTLKFQQQQQQHLGGGRGSQQWSQYSSMYAPPDSVPARPTYAESDYDYCFPRGAPPTGPAGFPTPSHLAQQQSYYHPPDSTGGGGGGGSSVSAAGGGSGRIPSSWSEYRSTVTTPSPSSLIGETGGEGRSGSAVPSLPSDGVGDIPGVGRMQTRPGQIPRRESFPLSSSPSASRLDSCGQGIYSGEYGLAGMGLGHRGLVGSPEDSMQMLAMSPNYMKYSNILHMLDIE